MYREITHNIQIDVFPQYIADRSFPEKGLYFFAYQVRLKNLGVEPVKLLKRHWIITNGKGETQDVQGEGIVGQTPSLAPGSEHEYSSFCPLPTPTGNMRGTYLFELESGETFKAKIPLFFLRGPLARDSKFNESPRDPSKTFH